MNPDQLSFLNPNYLHGCHPADLRSYFESDPFCENIDSAFLLHLVSEDVALPKLSLRQQVLERLLENIAAHDLVGQIFVRQYLRDQYRRNCRPNTLRQAAISLTQFLTFYRDLGKTQLEQIKRHPLKGPCQEKIHHHRKKVRFFAGTTPSNRISPFSLPASVISEVIGADPLMIC